MIAHPSRVLGRVKGRAQPPPIRLTGNCLRAWIDGAACGRAILGLTRRAMNPLPRSRGGRGTRRRTLKADEHKQAERNGTFDPGAEWSALPPAATPELFASNRLAPFRNKQPINLASGYRQASGSPR
jgi:hypothetical protein